MKPLLASIVVCSLGLIAVFAPHAVAGPTHELVYSFVDSPTIGKFPYAGLVQGSDGNFYGTTDGGGGASDFGTVFKITPAGVLSTLVQFTGNGATNKGANPDGGLVLGSDGNFYGTTKQGGANDLGTVFKMTPAGALTTLVEFTGNGATNKGAQPYAALVPVSGGTFYGTTNLGGASNYGTIFKMTSAGALTTLVEFTGNGATNKGANPYSGLVQGSDGNFYGTAFFGGTSDFGTVFKMTPAGALTTLVQFSGNGATNKGANPSAGLIQGVDGNFYGTTNLGGTGTSNFGTVFKMTAAGALTTLVEFTSNGATNKGAYPFAPLMRGSDGNFYGTAYGGGASGNGTVFKMTSAGALTTLVEFTGNGATNKGSAPFAGLVQGTDGNLYGTTVYGGGSNVGTVFRIRLGASASDVDFNADGKPDYLLVKASTGQTGIWYMNGPAFVSGANGPTLPAGWSIASTGDFNGDGKPDYLLVKASTGQTGVWYMNGATLVSGATGPTLPAGWSIVASKDFNADGKPDYVLFKASTGQTGIWYMNGVTFVSAANGPTLPAGWSVAGLGDFNGDGKPDYLLFSANSRQTFLWYLNGAATLGGAYGPTLPAGWSVIGSADFNGDGKPDYLLYYASTRQTGIWYMNGAALVSGANGPTVPAGWDVVAP